MQGRRVEKKPAAKKPGGSKKGPIIAVAVVGVVLAAYLGLCAWVGASDKIMPNVYVLGVDVSGMTEQEAQAAVDQNLDAYGDQVSATLCYGGWRGSITAAQMKEQWDDVADPAIQVSRGNFFTQGARYLSHLMGTTHMVQIPRSPENPALEQLLDQVESEVGGNVTDASYTVDGDRLVMTKGRTGVAVDRGEARKAALDAMNEALSLKFHEGKEGNVEVERELTPEETPPKEPDFAAIHQELYTEAKSAQMDPETHKITDHVVGVDLDMSALKAAYESAGEGETFSVPLTITQPQDTKASLESKLFRDLLGEGTTKVGGSANRKTNVKLSAAACNGVILLPGEEFSYNNTTGSRTADKGYLPAPIYVGDKSQDDVGGGICQTSSTIYYAVLHTTLEVTERHDHKFNTGYVTQGMDATVFYGSLDFRFKNNTEYPVKIVTSSYDKNGTRYLNVKIYGTNTDGRYAVPKSDVYDKVEPSTVYKAREDVPRGTLVLDREQYAYTGYSAHTYRYIYEKDGTLVEKQDMGTSKYATRPHIYYYNPLDGDPSTWPNGQPPKPATDPGTSTDPVTPEPDPGTGTAPVTPAPDPGAESGEPADPAPVAPSDPAVSQEPTETPAV